MGKTARWFKGLLGMKNKENVKNLNNSGDRKEKKRWSFGKPSKQIQSPTNSERLRSYISFDTETEQNKHAVAVAEATAAAADAAVAAAQAAVAVVRLTSRRGTVSFCGGRDKQAAVKIQTVFRSHLAKKALRALKGLVKLQALVRGFLVRKRAAATLYSMQALIRAQAAIRSDRARRSYIKVRSSEPPEFRCRNSNCYKEKIDTGRPQFRSRRNSSYTSDSHCQNVSCVRIPEFHHLQDFEWGFEGSDYKSSNTTQSTPRFAKLNVSNGSNGPTTPAKSVCGDAFLGPYSNYPSYMGSTRSSNAKLRSNSAPKQRPDPGHKKRMPLHEIAASRYSSSGLKMYNTCFEVEDALICNGGC